MLFYMDSKMFFNEYLQVEKVKDILNAQYICVSSNIRRRDIDFDNIICLTTRLYPSSHVFSLGSFKDMREAYYDQLRNEALPFIAEMIRYGLEEGNIIFICTHKELKHLKYLRWLSYFVYFEFGCCVYNYEQYIFDLYEGEEYNNEKALKKAKKIIKQAKHEQFRKDRQTKTGRRRIMNNYSQMSKKELKKIAKKHEFYTKGMSKSDILEWLEYTL